MFTQRVAAFAVFAILTLPASAMTVEEGIASALEHNADLSALRTTLKAAERAADSAWNEFLPQISASAGISQNHTLMTAAVPAPKDNLSWSGSAGATLSFTTAIPARMKALSLSAQKARLDYDNKQMTLRAEVSKKFYQLISDRANVDILKANQTLTRQQYEQLRSNYNNGLASELDMLNAQYSFQAAGPQVDDAVNTYNEHRGAFLLLLGLDPAASPEFAAEGEIDTSRIAAVKLASGAELADTYVEGRYDVAAAALALEQGKAAARVAGAARAPSVSLGETVRLSPKTGAAGLDFSEPTMAGSFSVNLSVPLSVWLPGSSSSLSVKTSAENIRALEDKLEMTRRTAREEVLQKAAAVERLRENLDVTALNQRITSRAYTLSVQGYRAGLVSQTELQAANQRMVSAEQTALTSKVNFLQAVYDLATALQIDIQTLTGDTA